jgi:hypothetical protein
MPSSKIFPQIFALQIKQKPCSPHPSSDDDTFSAGEGHTLLTSVHNLLTHSKIVRMRRNAVDFI